MNRIFNLNFFFCHHNIGRHCGYELKTLDTGCVVETLSDGTQECKHLKEETNFEISKDSKSLCLLTNNGEQTCSDNENLIFYNANNFEFGPILVAPKQEVCSSSGYFQVNFANNLYFINLDYFRVCLEMILLKRLKVDTSLCLMELRSIAVKVIF